METSDLPPGGRKRMSAEAMVGTGITIGALGLMFLLLAWAQQLREVNDAALILFVIGLVLLVPGALLALAGGAAKRRPE